jgi:polyisoprenoid-binding protein YceI
VSATDLNSSSSRSQLTTGIWRIDPDTSRIGFWVMSAPPAWGRFTDLRGELTVDDDLRGGGRGALEVESLRTGIGLRDRHLRSSHFFAADEHPQITFSVSGIDLARGGTTSARLTIKGITRTVDVDVRTEAVDGRPDARRLVGHGVLRRRDFGVSWMAMDRLMIGNRVHFKFELTFER